MKQTFERRAIPILDHAAKAKIMMGNT